VWGEKMIPLKRKVVIDLEDGLHLLVNPYTGAADVIDSETLHILVDGRIDALPDEAVSFLRESGQLVKEGEEDDLIHCMKVLCKKQHKEQSQDNSHILVVTYGCNLRCPYCFEKHLYRKGSQLMQTMDKKTVDALFNVILQMDSQANEHSLTLYGGEPLQLKNFSIIEYILKKGYEYGYSPTIITNGADLYHFVPLLSQVDVAEIHTTLDGPRSIHDQRRFKPGKIKTFDDIVKGIDMAVDHGIFVQLRVNIDSFNIEHLPEFAEFYKEKEWDPHVSLVPINVFLSECSDYSSVISEKEYTEKFIALLTTDERMDVFLKTFTYPHGLISSLFVEKSFTPWFWQCSSHTAMLVYDPLGDIYPCYEAVGNKEHKIGEYLPALQFNTAFNEWRNRTVFTIPECTGCNLAFFCGGGCAYAAYRKTGSITAPYCDIMKASVEYKVPFLYQLMKKGIDLSKLKKQP
jgi:uncharacterized protein